MHALPRSDDGACWRGVPQSSGKSTNTSVTSGMKTSYISSVQARTVLSMRTSSMCVLSESKRSLEGANYRRAVANQDKALLS